MPVVDPDFMVLPLAPCTDAALVAGARHSEPTHADVRVESNRAHLIRLRDGRLEGSHDGMDSGLAVRVVVDGSWGFAACAELTPEAAADAAVRAVQLARVSRALNSQPVELAAEPVQPNGVWVSSYVVDPFAVPDADKIALLAEWSRGLLAADGVDHVDASVYAVKERRYYADLAGTRTVQQRVRLEPVVTAVGVDRATGSFETHALAGPAGRPRLGVPHRRRLGLGGRAGRAAGHLAERVAAPSVEPGTYDLVIDPSNLWLTIHESVGHATELDRALGYEANYAGTSFATPDLLGTLRVRLGPDERHRRPGGRARAGHHGLGPRGRRGPVSSTWCARGSWSATSSTARWPRGWGCRGRTAARTPTRRFTCRCSGCPTCRCSRTPAAPPRRP